MLLHSGSTVHIVVCVEGSLRGGRAWMGGFLAKPAPLSYLAGEKSASEGWGVPRENWPE